MSDQPTQRGTAWLTTASPGQIDAAVRAGELNRLLAGDDPDAEPARTLSHEDIAAMTPEQIVEAAQRDPDLARRIGNADQGARGTKPPPGPRGILHGKSTDEIVAMHRAGQLDALMRGDH
jgi:hypothetical protein